MTQSWEIQANISQMKSSIASMQGQINALSRRRTELLEDRAGLEGFAQRVEDDRADFISQLMRKREAAAQAESITHSMIASSLSNALRNRYGAHFEGAVQGCYDGVRNETRRAMAVVDDELRQLNVATASLESEIASTRGRIAQASYDLERARAEEAASQS